MTRFFVTNWTVKFLKKKVGLERVDIFHIHWLFFTYLQICDVFVDGNIEKENKGTWNLMDNASKIILFSYPSFMNVSNVLACGKLINCPTPPPAKKSMS